MIDAYRPALTLTPDLAHGKQIFDDTCAKCHRPRKDGVRVGPSPFDVQRRLLLAGMRPISNVVDASNYVMLELGKPIHTFDAAAITGGRIIVRTATAGESVTTLDHVDINTQLKLGLGSFILHGAFWRKLFK